MNGEGASRRARRSSARSGWALLAGALVLAVATLVWWSRRSNDESRWLAAFGSPMASSSGPAPISSATYRQFAHLSIGGERVRVRLSNAFGRSPLVFQRATVARRSIGAALAPGSSRPLTVSGRREVVVPPGRVVYTDPVRMGVDAGEDLAISLFARGRPPISAHPGPLATEYSTLPRAGDHTRDERPTAFVRRKFHEYWVDGIDVETSEAAGSVAVLGDSISDVSAQLPRDSNTRWVDVLARRLGALGPDDGRRRAVFNASLGGNAIGRDGGPIFGISALQRLDLDVLSRAGVTDVIVFLGTNDIFTGASASEVIRDLHQLIARLRARDVRVIGVTFIPRDGAMGYDPRTRDPQRHAVNAWIRRGGAFDAVLDFDAVLRSADDSDRMDPRYQGDPAHPNVAGEAKLGDSVDLDIFASK